MAKGSRPHFHWPLHAHPLLRRAGWYPLSPETNGRPYQHPTGALHQHFYHGILEYENGPSLLLRPGDVTYSPPNAVTRYQLKTKGHHWCVHFDPVPVKKSERVELPLHLPPGKAGSYVTEKLRSLSDLHSRLLRKPKDQLIQSTLSFSLQELILWLALNNRRRPSLPGAKLEQGLAKAQSLLDENFRNPPDPHEIARLSGLNQNYLAANFKRHLGLTMDAYLLRRRLGIACQLLSTTRLAIKEVAYEAGIPDAQYFNKQFRRVFGVSPSLYRQSHGIG